MPQRCAGPQHRLRPSQEGGSSGARGRYPHTREGKGWGASKALEGAPRWPPQFAVRRRFTRGVRSRPPAGRRLGPPAVEPEDPDARTEPVPRHRPPGPVTHSGVQLRALGSLRPRLSPSRLRSDGQRLRHRVPARRGWPDSLGLSRLHPGRRDAALSRLRADRLERSRSPGYLRLTSPCDGTCRRSRSSIPPISVNRSDPTAPKIDGDLRRP